VGGWDCDEEDNKNLAQTAGIVTRQVDNGKLQQAAATCDFEQ
jgi:hypothetical protein